MMEYKLSRRGEEGMLRMKTWERKVLAGRAIYIIALLGLFGGICGLPCWPVALAGQDPFSRALTREIALQQGVYGYEGCEDTGISQSSPDRNYEGNENFLVRSQDTKAGLIRFDLTTIPDAFLIPPGAIVTGAWLDLYTLWGESGRTLDAGLYEVLRQWNPAQATWNMATSRDFWEAPGCNDPYFDRNETVSSRASIRHGSTWYTFDITPLVHKWLADPSTNHGVILKDLTSSSVEYSFASAEQGYQAWRPKLRIRYVRQTLTPTSRAYRLYLLMLVNKIEKTLTPTLTPSNTPSTTPAPSVTPSNTPPITRTPSVMPSVTPSLTCVELSYDDGSPEAGVLPHDVDQWLAVRFTTDSPRQIAALRFYVKGESTQVRVAIYQSEITGTLLYSAETDSPYLPNGGWWDIRTEGVPCVTGDFYVVLEWQEGPSEKFKLGQDQNGQNRQRSFTFPPFTPDLTGNYMIRVCMLQCPNPRNSISP